MQRSERLKQLIFTKTRELMKESLNCLKSGDLRGFERYAERLKGMDITIRMVYQVGIINGVQYKQIRTYFQKFTYRTNSVFNQLRKKSHD